MPRCPYCQRDVFCIKSGFNRNGTQRYRCRLCRRYFTPLAQSKLNSGHLKDQARDLYLRGYSLRSIAKEFGVHHQTVDKWITHSTQQIRKQAIDLYLKNGSVPDTSYELGMRSYGSRAISLWIRKTLPFALKEMALELHLWGFPPRFICAKLGVKDDRTIRKWIREAKMLEGENKRN